MQENDTGRETLPAELVEALRSGDRPPPMITARIDREILDLAAEQFSARPRRARRRRSAWVAVAASLLLAVIVLPRLDLDRDLPPDLAYDIDGSGRVDIADVLLLARERRVSQAEIDALATRIVSLSAEGGTS